MERELTSLAGASPEACSSALADEAVPALLARSVVLARVAVALFASHLAARRLDARHVLGLGDLPDVLAASVNEQIPHAAHVAVVEHCSP